MLQSYKNKYLSKLLRWLNARQSEVTIINVFPQEDHYYAIFYYNGTNVAQLYEKRSGDGT